MVVLILTKQAEEFCIDAAGNTPVDAVARLMARVHNARALLGALADAAIELAKYGPMRPDEMRG
jgi:hypothetical protein